MSNIKTSTSTSVIKKRSGLLPAIEVFLSSQDIKESSRETYRKSITQFFAWVLNKGYDVDNIGIINVIEYKEDLLQRGMSTLTVGSYITALKSFYGFYESRGLGKDITKGVKLPRRKQQYKKQALTDKQGTELLDHVQATSPRDYAIVNLLIRTGLRTIELIRANIEDITTKRGKRVLLVQGKGRDEKDNFVILTDRAYDPIRDYLATRPKAMSGEPLFTSISNNSAGKRLTTRSIRGLVKDGLRKIGVDNRDTTAHSLRHTTAINILKITKDLSKAQAVLRHTNPATTQIYTKSIEQELRIETAPEEVLDALFQNVG